MLVIVNSPLWVESNLPKLISLWVVFVLFGLLMLRELTVKGRIPPKGFKHLAISAVDMRVPAHGSPLRARGT